MLKPVMAEQVVGRVAAVWRYPVKSMAGEHLDAVDVSWHGLAGDRRWAFVRKGLERSGFPWLTLRQRSDLWSFRPSFADRASPDRSSTLVTTPDGERFDVTDPALAARLGHGARVIKQDRGVFDASPLSLITTQTIDHIAATVGRDLEVLRFRPNFVVDAATDAPFAEDDWVGATPAAWSSTSTRRLPSATPQCCARSPASATGTSVSTARPSNPGTWRSTTP
ncbi:MAG TPA: MOSC N-terminal beta barrel domain-containing protein [Jiangellaceae bacterium]